MCYFYKYKEVDIFRKSYKEDNTNKNANFKINL